MWSAAALLLPVAVAGTPPVPAGHKSVTVKHGCQVSVAPTSSRGVAPTRDGNRYIYAPVTPAAVAGRAALSNLVRTFFGGSVKGAVSALLEAEAVDEHTLDELAALVEHAKDDTP